MLTIPAINLSSHGGVRILIELANLACQQGTDVRFVIPKGKISAPYSINKNIQIHEIGIDSGIKALDYAIFLLLLPFIRGSGHILANFFVTFPSCWLMSKIHRCELTYFVQDIESKYHGAAGKALNLICELTYQSKDIATANPYLAAAILKRKTKPKIEVNIGPNDIFFKTPIKRSNEYDIMYMPRHESWKRMDRFIEILDIISRSKPGARILCVSQDPIILARMKELGAETCLPKNDQELIACYDRSTTFLLTSDREGFGLPPLEAMSRMTPVVAFRCGGPELYIQDGINSYICDTTAQAAEHLLALLEVNNPTNQRLAINAHSTALEYSLSTGIRPLLNLLTS